MSPLLMSLLGLLLLPLFVGTWRTSLACLAGQGFLMSWIYLRATPSPSAHGWLTLADLALVRGLAAPFALYAVMRTHHAPARADVIPPNLFSWTLALTFVLIAFDFSGAFPVSGAEQHTLLAVAAAGVLLGLLVLATQSDPFSQIMGALRIEYAIALFELGQGESHVPLAIQTGQVTVIALTIGFFASYLHVLTREPERSAGTDEEEATL